MATARVELVRELSETRGTGFGMFSSPKEVGQGTIDALSASVAVLGQKAPDELEAYRALVLDIATAVAEAKGGVKDEEKAAIDKITAALERPGRPRLARLPDGKMSI